MELETGERRGTRAHEPDLDWSQVLETVLMLELSAGQIEAAMKDSNTSVEVLTDSFTSMAGLMGALTRTLNNLPDNDETTEVKGTLRRNADELSGMVQHSIIAFQFYDKLVQRLSHVCHSLSTLSDLVKDPNKRFLPNEWVILQEKICSKYTTVEEVEMFEAVLNGMPVREALERYISSFRDKGSDVELF